MSDFGIELDDDLLNAALEAVEKVEQKSKAARASRAHQDDDEGVGIALVEDAPPGEDGGGADLGGELEIDLDVDLDALADEAAAALDDGDEAASDDDDDDGDTPARPAGDASLQAALDAARAELAASRKHARALDQEIGRLKGSVRRLQDQAARATSAATQALEARKAAEEQRRSLRDRNHELKQELDHIRERRRRERDEDRSFGHQRTVELFLPVLDNLELALEHQSGDSSRVVQGVQMILQQFHQSLSQLGVQRVVSGEGVLFDPEVHEAISEVYTDELLPGSIVAELRPGYSLNGRLLRASRVTVAAPTDPPTTEHPITAEPTPSAPDAADASPSTASRGDGPEGPDGDASPSDTDPSA
ncbi:MAG: nucleotide exchange factor GrpE [Alphaproteobacteria bacterium]|nr:nucleotide exchange factor GrpE [Alphaproteobacteria bacterium]